MFLTSLDERYFMSIFVGWILHNSASSNPFEEMQMRIGKPQTLLNCQYFFVLNKWIYFLFDCVPVTISRWIGCSLYNREDPDSIINPTSILGRFYICSTYSNTKRTTFHEKIMRLSKMMIIQKSLWHNKECVAALSNGGVLIIYQLKLNSWTGRKTTNHQINNLNDFAHYTQESIVNISMIKRGQSFYSIVQNYSKRR